MDGSYRDIASIHSTYRKTDHTKTALLLIGKHLEQLEVPEVFWFFDSPVSNSGKLKVMMHEIAEENKWNWDIQLVYNPDKAVVAQKMIAISSDSWVMDRVSVYFNLNRMIIDSMQPQPPILNFEIFAHDSSL